MRRARRQGVDLRPVFSGHMGFWTWGPPPEDRTVVVLVGGRGEREEQAFADCTQRTRISNTAGIDNGEAGQPISVCTLAGTWSAQWPQLQSYR